MADTPPPLPKPNSGPLILATLLVICASGAVVQLLVQNGFLTCDVSRQGNTNITNTTLVPPKEAPPVVTPETGAGSTPAPPLPAPPLPAPPLPAPPLPAPPLPAVDFATVIARSREFRPYVEQIDAQTTAEYNRRNPKDAPSYEDGLTAARLFACCLANGDFYGECYLQIANSYAERAYKEGCRDPLIRTISEVYFFQDRYIKAPERAQKLRATIDDLLATQYPPHCALAAFGAAIHASGAPEAREIPAMQPAVALIPGLVDEALAQAVAMTKDEVSRIGVAFAMRDFSAAFEDQTETLQLALEKSTALLPAAGLPPNDLAYIQGRCLLDLAWAYRGNGSPSTVTPEGEAGMKKSLAQAGEILTRAAEKFPTDPRLPALMINVELGQDAGQYRMNQWFDLAVKADPNYYPAYSSKMYYLQPRSYGSVLEVIDFGRVCQNTENWANKTPLVLLEGFEAVTDFREELYTDPRIWKPVQEVCEEYLRRYPESLHYRTRYFRFAVHAKQWDVAREQLRLLGDTWDHNEISDREFAELKATLAAAGGA